MLSYLTCALRVWRLACPLPVGAGRDREREHARMLLQTSIIAPLENSTASEERQLNVHVHD